MSFHSTILDVKKGKIFQVHFRNEINELVITLDAKQFMELYHAIIKLVNSVKE